MKPANDPWDLDEDSAFAASRMSIPEYIEDLRTHLLRALTGFLAALVISIVIAAPVLDFITAPVKEQLGTFQKRQFARWRTKLAEDVDLQKKNEPRLVHREVNIRALARALNLPRPKQEWLNLPTRSKPLDEALDLLGIALCLLLPGSRETMPEPEELVEI